jgi:hypothetical protein
MDDPVMTHTNVTGSGFAAEARSVGLEVCRWPCRMRGR